MKVAAAPLTVAGLVFPFLALLTSTSLCQDAEIWKRLSEATPSHVYPQRGRLQRSPEPEFDEQLVTLEKLATDAKGTGPEPLILFYKANAEFKLGKHEAAMATLRGLRERFPVHALCRPGKDERGEDEPAPVDDFIADCSDEIEIRKSYVVTELPRAELDETAVAIVHTSLGDFEITFYSSVAPEATKNFRKLARDGFYNGSYFHHVQNFRLIEGGCPNTKEPNRDRGDDGMGGPGYTLPLELSDAMHLPGSVSMRQMPDGKAVHGSQFTICVNAQPQLNNVQSPMGQVTKGMEVVRRIAQQRADDQNNPFDEVRITGVEWRK